MQVVDQVLSDCVERQRYYRCGGRNKKGRICLTPVFTGRVTVGSKVVFSCRKCFNITSIPSEMSSSEQKKVLREMNEERCPSCGTVAFTGMLAPGSLVEVECRLCKRMFLVGSM